MIFIPNNFWINLKYIEIHVSCLKKKDTQISEDSKYRPLGVSQIRSYK